MKMCARECWASVIQCGLTQGVPHPDDTFDMVICEQLLEHLHDPAAVIRELVRVLKQLASTISIPS
jgi:2-polyprenyl-3-methyl-5-hydroxy-6-metoxy-1,4-benzoquinol methylase